MLRGASLEKRTLQMNKSESGHMTSEAVGRSRRVESDFAVRNNHIGAPEAKILIKLTLKLKTFKIVTID